MDDINVVWGERDFRADWSGYKVSGYKYKREGEAVSIDQPLTLTLSALSSHIHGSADVSVSIRMKRAAVYDLFEKSLEFEARDNPALLRLGKAFLKELRGSKKGAVK